MQPPTSWIATTVAEPLPLRSYRRLAPFASIQSIGRALPPQPLGSPGVCRNLSVEHREDLLPVARRALRVEDVAVGQRVAVLGAFVDRVAIVDRARTQERLELLHHRQRGVGIHLGEPAIELAPEVLGQVVRRVGRVADEARTVQARRRGDLLGEVAGDAQHVSPTHAVADRTDAARTYRLLAPD